ncbi:TetR/AcrR family transcriptional regulator [Vibrio sp. T187]|uniref:TetR/AcrR family transcriptional regulator n=1 Tax=Vibrio TaxID=662 RepID=UPI0010C9799B|nr:MULTISPECIES: TetR/AcrR family transcriptional regulator [Vibrio]MBW3695838.1 TetR/AcrR family transcriptional regulator [Vibrio sp. T187]
MSSSSELKRNRILEAAAELFGIHGYNASMDSIAKLADVSKQTVYSHFKTKDLLFEASMKMKCLENQSDQAIFDPDASIEEALFQFGLGLHQTLLKPGAQNTYRNAVSNIESHPEFAQVYLRFGPEQTTTLLEEYLERKVADGTIKLQLSSHDSAVQLLLMFHGKAVYWRYLGVDIEQTDAQRDTYLKSCVDMFLSHLRC